LAWCDANLKVRSTQQERVKTVAIAIPALHRPDLTARCIEFLQRQTLPSDEWEIVVIENETGAGEMLADPLPRNTQRIELPANEGTTGSINRAVAATNSRYVLLLNNDVELAPDYLARLVAALDADPKLGFATGKLLRATERTHLDGAGDAMLMSGAGYRLGHRDRDAGQFDRTMPVLAGCGAAVLYRREAFVTAGQLDPDFFAYLDDLDLALRVQLVGFKGLYLPDAIAYHIGSATLGGPLDPNDRKSGGRGGPRLHPRVIELITRNQFFLLTKDYPRPLFLRLLPRIAFYQFLWMMFAIRNSGSGAWLRGLRAALRGRSGMQEKHRKLMARRRIGDGEFLERLRDSERQIREWQQSLPPEARSRLLNLYFRVFGK
jgi:GT2 family glycosyltransferase